MRARLAPVLGLSVVLACGDRQGTEGDELSDTGSSSSESDATSSTSSEGSSDESSSSAQTESDTNESESDEGDLTRTDVLSGLACEAPIPRASDERWAAFLAKREGWLHVLAEPVLACVEQRDTSHPAFHGCIDWHSAVHGTWALHALYRMTGAPVYLEAANVVLDPSAIAGELEDIEQANLPAIELLYGRAWFLLLARERELASGATDLRPHAEAIADQLAAVLESQSPAQLASWVTSDDYFNASWALLNLWRWSVHVGDTVRAQWVEGLVADVVMSTACPLVDEVGFSDDFFPPCLHRAMTVLTVLPAEQTQAWLADELPADGELALMPLCEPSPAHVAGLNFSRAWGLWALWRASGDTDYRDLYVEHVWRHVEQPAYWAEDYWSHSHWIAQFGIHAIWLSWER